MSSASAPIATAPLHMAATRSALPAPWLGINYDRPFPLIKKESHCPIVIDPSQGAGRADLVAAMCKGAVAMGADALLIEVHPNPAEAWSDGAQQLSLERFATLMDELRPFIQAAGRE